MSLDTRTKTLIAVGASVTANCQPCLQYHASQAREAGAEEGEITMAIAIAKAVRKGAAAKMDDFMASLGAEAATTSCCASGQGCDCGAN